MKILLLTYLLLMMITSCSTTAYHYYKTSGATPVFSDAHGREPVSFIQPNESFIVKGKPQERNLVRYQGDFVWIAMDSVSYLQKADQISYYYAAASKAKTPTSGNKVSTPLQIVKAEEGKEGTPQKK